MSVSRLASGLLLGVCASSAFVRPAIAQVAVAAPTSAEPTAADAAERLFRDAVQLMESGNYAEACPKLAESHKLDPAGGTVVNLGYCLEKSGKLVSAYAAYKEAVQRAQADGREDRASMARARLVALEPRLAYVRVRLGADVADLPGITVTLDGRALSQAELAAPMPVDAGAHAIRVHATGRLPFNRNVEVPNAPTTLEISVDQLIQPALPASKPATDAAPRDVAARPQEQPRSRTAIWVLSATGVVLGGVGSYAGLKAMDMKNDGEPKDAYNRWANVSNAGFGLGGAALAAALYLWLKEPRSPSGTATKVQFHPSSATVRF